MVIACFFIGLLFSIYAQAGNVYERSIVVVSASYNNQKWYKFNLSSVFAQQYTNYRLIYIDDCSSDNTFELVSDYICEQQQEHRVTLIHNDVRKGALANQYHAIHSCNPHDIIVILDADDAFSCPRVLSYINEVYADPMIWMTYGQFVQVPGPVAGLCRAFPDEVIANNAFRDYEWLTSHLRTFYAALFCKIKKEDLMYNGDFMRMTGDVAAMFPMIEMARNGHFTFISDILVLYNAYNEINDCKVSAGFQLGLCNWIRKKQRYTALEILFN